MIADQLRLCESVPGQEDWQIVDYLACSAARKLATCSQRRSFRRAALERVILDLPRERLMQIETVAEFICTSAPR